MLDSLVDAGGIAACSRSVERSETTGYQGKWNASREGMPAVSAIPLGSGWIFILGPVVSLVPRSTTGYKL